MIKSFKKKLRKIIFECIHEHENRQISKSANPYGLNIQATSYIIAPFKIEGGKNIFIGKNTFIGKDGWISAYDYYAGQKFFPEITIGENVNIGNHACITAISHISIGDNCLFSEYVYISDHSHGFDPAAGVSPVLQPLESKGPVEIGAFTFLGFRVCILPGVVLGKNCIVGSNTVVTKSFPDYSMIGGIPGRLLKTYSPEAKKWLPAE